jgi:transposase
MSRWESTSQVCSECAYKWGKLDLKVRSSVRCLNCGTEHDRDENAAQNINEVSQRVAVSPLGGCLNRPVEVALAQR